ncbi:MAG: DNA polymerase II large subunit [Salinirussus sp.]
MTETPLLDDDARYFEAIEADLDHAMQVAERARERGGDPHPDVEIPVATDMADRVENLLDIPGVATRVRELEADHSREEAALALVEDFVDGTVGAADSRAGTIEEAVRTAVALLTEGVVAAPIEGIDRVELLENDDGTEFVNVYYAGPIRSAGGTAQALSVLVADYARTLLGIDEFQPRSAEIGRYAEEVALYDEDTGLQYTPSEDETRYIAEHCPIMLDGEATGGEEVSGHRDLDRVDTNAPRGGMCLVLAEGIALKAPKLQRYVREIDAVDWPWLQPLIDGDYASDGAGDESANEPGEDPAETTERGGDGPPRVEPQDKYLRDLIAGRPVFGHPSEPGGFRLRYGRARNHGFATAGVHPATMHLVDDFLAAGTQLKTERPGKAAGVVPVDSIEGPTVRLATGEVRRIDDPAEAQDLRNGVEAIIDLGEYLVNAGEFVENNHELAPSGYTPEWWREEFAAAGGPIQALEDRTDVDLDAPNPERALSWATDYDAPLHPRYTYCWHDITVDALELLVETITEAEVVTADGAEIQGSATSGDLAIPRRDGVADTLEALLVEHVQRDDDLLVPDWRPFVRSIGFAVAEGTLERVRGPEHITEAAREYDDGENAIEAVNDLAPFAVRERAPTRIGARMGRPEKSEVRELSPAVHTLFPLGEAGGNQRDVAAAAGQGDDLDGTKGRITVDVARRACIDCTAETFRARCPDCGGRTRAVHRCPDCDREVEPNDSGQALCPRCDVEATATAQQTIDISDELEAALTAVNERESAFEVLKGVKGLTSAAKVPEPLEKGILRAKHGVSAFKDGTVRYDMTDLPVTAVRPIELDVSVEQFRALGYEQDIHGDPLEHADQLVELRVQDIVLSAGAAEHLQRTADFVDDLLESYYGLEPYYEIENRDDLVGELVFGMAPHTSAATVGRIVGFTTAAVGYAHPYFHAAKRRNCFHPDTTITYDCGDADTRSDSIARFVEERLDDPTVDDFGVQTASVDDDLQVQSLRDNGTWVRKQVTAVSKHPAPDHLVKVVTETGRSLTVTPDHRMITWDNAVHEVRAHNLSAGDVIPVDTATRREQVDCSPASVTDGGIETDVVASVEFVASDVAHTYCLTVEDTHTVVANGILTGQCDGDEDCVMLLMDGLLNFSKTYLPDKRGGSVAEDARLVAVDPDDNLRFLSFEDFWNELSSPIESDGKFRKRTCYSEGWRTYAFSDTHEASLRPIEKAIRYQADADETLVEIETEFGRSLTITDHHSLFRYEDGIEEVAGADLNPGDRILAPKTLEVDTEPFTLDVVECCDELYVFIDDHVEDLITTAWDAAARDDAGDLPFRTDLSDLLSAPTISYERLQRLLGRVDFTVPQTVMVGQSASVEGIARAVEVDEDVAWLLGLFMALGGMSGAHPAIHSVNEELADRAADIFAASFGTDPRCRRSNQGCELFFPTVFAEILSDLDIVAPESHTTRERAIPERMLTAPREVARAFLRGYMAGQSNDRRAEDPNTVALHTTNEQIKDGLVFLLHRLGIVANVSERCGSAGKPQEQYVVSVPRSAVTTAEERPRDTGECDDPQTLDVAIPDALLEIREMDVDGVKDTIPEDLHRRNTVSIEFLREIIDTLDASDLPTDVEDRLDDLRPLVDGDLSYLRVTDIQQVDYDGHLYDLQVGGDPIFTANWLYAHNSMDAPLVMSSRIDPAEIDDEAHNIDVVDGYSRSFYEATLERADPEEVGVDLAANSVGTADQYRGFGHTHDTSDIASGPALSAYKTLGTMEEKTESQLALARRLRAVDEADVAERVIEYHFLPDLIGNLRAFSRQETRCHDCGTSYRRMPLTGDCRECGGDVHLTVHEGSVTKYLETAKRVAAEYGAREYTVQRLEILERSIDRLFENDRNKQSGIADFM